MASVKQFQVAFDCAEPERVARLWYEALGYAVPPPAGSKDHDKFDETDPVVRVSPNPVHRSPAAALCARSDAGGQRRDAMLSPLVK
ncbi:VOC family protein [Streptomyces sp. NPDC052042]|uniref:VOC family protein n=1 Tax=Streptomyces sp. NPDC052042 TaxID=3365683 RepID=UPI0037D736B8